MKQFIFKSIMYDLLLPQVECIYGSAHRRLGQLDISI